VPHFYPVVIPAGRSLPGDSLGFHAYSLRIDNLTNQWLLEETSLAWIPPYSLGVCLRLYGTGVAIVLNQAPSGQAQPAPLAGEATVGVFSDQLRTEVAGSPVRQFALVQAVSDLTEGAQPAFPPVGTCRLWADNTGTVHHEHSDGTDYVVLDAHNFTSYVTPPYVLNIVNTQALGGVLAGTLPNPTHANILHHFPQSVSVDSGYLKLGAVAAAGPYTMPRFVLYDDGSNWANIAYGTDAQVRFIYGHTPSGALLLGTGATNDGTGAFTLTASLGPSGNFNALGWIAAGGITPGAAGDLGASRGGGVGALYLGDTSHYLINSAGTFVLAGGPLQIPNGGITSVNGNIAFAVGTNLLLWPDGSNIYASGGMNLTTPNTNVGFYNSTLARNNLLVRADGFLQLVQATGLLANDGSARMRVFTQVGMTTTIGGIFAVTPGVTRFHGIVMIIINSAQMIMASLNGGANAVNIIWSNCGATNGFGVGSTFNVGFSTSDYYLENRTGQAYIYSVFAFGIN
jgi:hypothetical protein